MGLLDQDEELENNHIGTDIPGDALGNRANGLALVFGTYVDTIDALTIEYNSGVGLYTYQTGLSGLYNS